MTGREREDVMTDYKNDRETVVYDYFEIDERLARARNGTRSVHVTNSMPVKCVKKSFRRMSDYNTFCTYTCHVSMYAYGIKTDTITYPAMRTYYT